MTGHISHRIHQWSRTAAIKMPSVLLLKNGPEIVGFVGITTIVVQNHPVSELRSQKLVLKCHKCGIARKIVQFEV